MELKTFETKTKNEKREIITSQKNYDILKNHDIKTQLENRTHGQWMKTLRDKLKLMVDADNDAMFFVEYFTDLGWVSNDVISNNINELLKAPVADKRVKSGDWNNILRDNEKIFGVRITEFL